VDLGLASWKSGVERSALWHLPEELQGDVVGVFEVEMEPYASSTIPEFGTPWSSSEACRWIDVRAAGGGEGS
jgi:hypothetical protein